MNLPTFETQPDERVELQPKIAEVLTALDFKVYEIDGLFDLLVSNPKGVDSYLELKVRLASQNHSIPLSRLQWQCLSEHDSSSRFEDSYRVLIYDYRNGGTYAFVKAGDLKLGITPNQPTSTSYIRADVMNGLSWLSAESQLKNLVAWLRR
jgi:hypothetical protein